MPSYPLKTDDVRLTTEPPKCTNAISRCPLTISDNEAPIIVVNAGFSFQVLFPRVLLYYVFTNINKANNWKDPHDDIPYTGVASFAVSLSVP